MCLCSFKIIMIIRHYFQQPLQLIETTLKLLRTKRATLVVAISRFRNCKLSVIAPGTYSYVPFRTVPFCSKTTTQAQLRQPWCTRTTVTPRFRDDLDQCFSTFASRRRTIRISRSLQRTVDKLSKGQTKTAYDIIRINLYVNILF